MLQTNLIGRQFTTRNDKSVLTVVAVFVNQGRLWLTGESERGSLLTYQFDEVKLIPAPRGQAEDLRGII